MVNRVQPVQSKGPVEEIQLEALSERRSAADGSATPKESRPAIPTPASTVHFSAAVFDRQKAAVSAKPRGEGRSGKRVDSKESAEAEAAWASDQVRRAAPSAVRAQANAAAERVYDLLHD